MVYTEVRERGGRKYYYRTLSVRDGGKVGKRRVYLGEGLDDEELLELESYADTDLGDLKTLLEPDEVQFLNKLKEERRALSASTERNRYEHFVSMFTHDSTAIEGNTLTLRETSNLLFDHVAPAKRMREVYEVLDHRDAFDLMMDHEGGLDRRFILDLHRMAMENSMRSEAQDQIGKYRTVQVYIHGTEWMPVPPEEVPGDMRNLLAWYTRNKTSLHPIVLAVYFHIGFEIIHPFADGNGRVGRLLMNHILHINGYPMVNIPYERRSEYYECLAMAQDNGDLRPFIELVLDLYRESDVIF